MLSALLLPDYLLGTPPGHAVLTTTGRKTGKAPAKCYARSARTTACT